MGAILSDPNDPNDLSDQKTAAAARPLVVDEERPALFWYLMGPHFASEKTRREMPYLADRPGRLWVVVPGADEYAAARAFACADPGEDATLREVWADRGEEEAGAEAARTALQYLLSTGALRVRATVKGRAVGMLKTAGFVEYGTKGSYTLLEARP
jgi:hypothetical protein